jgi:hypothetical protein
VNRSDIVGRRRVGCYHVDEGIGHGINLWPDSGTGSDTMDGRRGRREEFVSKDK